MRNLVVIGMKDSGKTTLAHRLAHKYDLRVHSISDHTKNSADEGVHISDLLNQKITNVIIDATEHTPLDPNIQPLLSQFGPVVLIDLNPEVNFQRISQRGLPEYRNYQDNPRQLFDEQLLQRVPTYQAIADIILRLNTESENEMLRKFINLYES